MTEQKNQAALPFVMALIGNAIWGMAFIPQRMALQVEGSTPAALLTVRFAMASLCLTVIGLIRGKKLFPRRKGWSIEIATCISTLLYYLFESYGIKYTNATFAGVVLSVSPIFGILFAALFLREYPTWRQVLFSLLPIAGVIIMSVSGQELGIVQAIGIVFLFLTCLSSGAFKTLNRASSRCFDAFERTYYSSLFSFAFFTAMSLVETKGHLEQYVPLIKNPSFILPLVVLVLFSSLLANLMCNYAAGKLSVLKVTAFGAVSTVCSAVGGYLFLNEPMPPAFLIGTVLVIVGVFLVMISKGREKT